VLVACHPDLVPAVNAIGMSAAVVGKADHHMDDVREENSEDAFPQEAFGRRDTDFGRFLWAITAHNWAERASNDFDDYLALAREWGPELILHDPIALIGRLLAGILDIPSVCHRWGIDPTNGPFENKAQEMLTPLANRHHLPRLPHPTLILDPCPPRLQVSDAPPADHIRYIPYNGAGTRPDWMTTPKTRHRICVCLGNSVLSLTGPRPFQRIIDAIADLPDTEIIATLTPENQSAIGELPADIRVTRSLPLNLFLHTCEVLICAGGSGTGLTATALGIPQLVLPQWSDQFDYGRRLAETGAGITLPTKAQQADPDQIRAATIQLLTNPGYTEQARKLQAEIRNAPSPNTMVTALHALAADHRGTRA
jgi:UDP:flavonoid glycosyltransferase YjiC (YdhE family)